MARTDRVDTPQLLEVVLSPPSGFSRLFIFTGTVIFQLPLLGPRDDDNMVRDRVDVSLSRIHNDIPFSPNITQVIASASPSSIKGTSDADEVTWAVDRAFADITPQGELVLHVDAAIQGSGGLLSRFAYQVFLQTSGMLRIRAVRQLPSDPINISTSPVDIRVILFPDSPNPTGGRVNFHLLEDNGNLIVNSTIGLPDFVDIPANVLDVEVSGRIPPDILLQPGTLRLTLVCITTLSIFNHTITIRKVSP